MSALFRPRKVDFDGLYRRHAPSVYRYTFAVVGNRADAEDLTQQTFLNAYRAIAGGTKPRKPENWLLRIAHNEVRRYFKTNGRAVEVEFDDEVTQSEPPRDDPALADVLRGLWKLPPIQRSALVMREFEGRPYAEIAELLGVTQSALETLLFRARRDLAEHLDEALTCGDAEQALSRRLDGRLPRRESRRLKEHLHECARCVRFAELQKRQRSVLKGLSIMPIPASLFLFRGEHAAAAAGIGGATAAGAGGAGVGAGLLAKAAAVTAAASVAGGVGLGAVTGPTNATPAERKSTRSAATVSPSETKAAQTRAISISTARAKSAARTVVHPRRKAEKAKPQRAKPAKQVAHAVKKDKGTSRFDGLKGKPEFVPKPPKTKPASVKPATRGTRTRRRGATAPRRLKPEKPRPVRPPRQEKPKPPAPDEPLPAATEAAPAPPPKKPRT